MTLTPEEKRIYRLTQNNTSVNRDIKNKRDDYVKGIEPEYKDIYGNKGIKFCEEMKNDDNQNEVPKKQIKVKFSSIVQYSRN